MTREEIIEKIRYKGEYTEAVKKRLKKLIKQYHPDVNKKDKETIKILYEIKKELENNTLKYTSNTSQDNDNNNSYDYLVSFFEIIIDNLKKKRDEINNKISLLYKRYNKKIDEQNEKTEELTEIVFKIENLNYEMEKLKKIDILDKLLITLMLITILGTFIFKFYFLILVLLFFIIAEGYYIYVRYLDYNNIKYLLKKTEKKRKIVDEEFDSIEDNLKKMRKEEIDLKREKTNVNNDIQYYSYEMSKLNNNDKSKSKENGYVKK